MRIAIAGTGAVAGRHLGVLRSIDGLELVGHLSASRQRAEAQASRWGGQPYTDLDAMLDREQPEAVWLCVTPDRHGPLELALIARGIPFFAEKPLAADLATAERIAEALSHRPLVTAVGYKFRALDTLPRVRELLAEQPAQLLIGAWHGGTPAAKWWRDLRHGGGQIVEQATHLLDLARLLAGEPEVVATSFAPGDADSSVPRASATLLRFPGNVPGTLTATRILPSNIAAQLQLFCTGRCLSLTERFVRIEPAGEHIEAREDPYLRENEAFLRAVREADPRLVLCDYADALRTHRLCCQIEGHG